MTRITAQEERRAIWISIVCILLCLLLTGCPWDPPEPKPPQPLPTPTPDSWPHIMATGNGPELRVGGNKAIAAGLYHVLVDVTTFPDRAAVRQAFRELDAAGFNLARVWALFPAESDWINPWKIEDGLYQLDTPDPAFWDRAEMVAEEADRAGVCIAWTAIDFWAIRAGGDHHPLAPWNHHDPWVGGGIPPAMPIEKWGPGEGKVDEFGNPHWKFMWSRQRWPFKVREDGAEIGGRNNPALYTVIRQTAALAERHNDLVYICNELHTDPGHHEYDRKGMVEWTLRAIGHIRDLFPGAIIGASVGDEQADAVYPLVDIADTHGLGVGAACDPSRIAGAVSSLRQTCPETVICSDNDGCMSSPRYTDPDWLERSGREAWKAGAFPEWKCPYPIPPALVEAGQRLRGS